MKDIKIGIIGCGLFGQAIIDTLKTIPYVRVTAISDQYTKFLHAAAKKYRIKNAFKDFRELCKLPELDAVCVVTREHEHAKPVLTAFKNGKHVYCEKPLASTLADGKAMVAAAEKSGLIFQVGKLLRFTPHYAKAKEEIAAGKIGKIVTIHARRNRPKTVWRWYNNSKHTVPFLLENSVHDIDVILWYIKDRVVNVRAFTRQIQKGGMPDVNWGMMEFAGGALAVVETTWLIPEQSGIVLDDSMQIIGTKGVLNIKISSPELSLWGNKGFQAYDTTYDTIFHNHPNGGLLSEMQYFASCVASGKHPKIITAQEAFDAMKISLALIESGKKKKDVRVTKY
jgi:predicted dehydrogenase